MRKKIVTLALQGGGSHGAFTWGVLDRLLEDPRIEIDGEAYWDGGFTANPPILPLLHLCKARDIVLVLLHSHPRVKTPVTVDEIGARLTEIGFSAALSTELQGIALAQFEARRGWFAFGRLERRLRALRDAGRSQTELWLAQNFEHLGKRSTLSLDRFLG